MTVSINPDVAGGAVGGVPTSRTINGYPLSANITLTGDDITTTPYVVPATTLSITRTIQQYTMASASDTLSFAAGSPVDGMTIELKLVGYSALGTLNIPSAYSEENQVAITSFVVPTNWKGSIFLSYKTDTWYISNLPQAAYLSDTWANIKATTPSVRTRGFATDVGDYGAEVEYLVGAGWGPANGRQLLSMSGASVTRNADNSTDQTVTFQVTKTIRGGMLASNGGLEFHWESTAVSGGQNATLTIQYGGSGGTVTTGAGQGRGIWRMTNANVTNSQKHTAQAGITNVSSNTAYVTSAIDSTANADVRFGMNWAANMASGSFTLGAYAIYWIGRGN